MAFDAFLQIDGIDGESADDAHKGQIDVQSWSWGATNSGSVGSGGGGGSGKVAFQDFHITKAVDAASPPLMLACATGQHIKSAKLFVRKSSDGRDDYLVYTLTDVLVSSFGDHGASGEAPGEDVEFRYRRIEMAYTTASGKTVRAGWDLATNKKV
jgi:type VI secretion system secreted protein Hcp